MKTIWTLICTLCFVLVLYGCDVPYSGGFGPGDLDRLLSEQDDTICLDDGFDTACIKAISGPRGRDGRDGLTIITLRTIQSIVYVLPETKAAASTALTVEIGEPVTADMLEIVPEPESVVITPTEDGGTVEIVPNPEAKETTVKVTPPAPEPPPIVRQPEVETPVEETPPIVRQPEVETPVEETPPIVRQPEVETPVEETPDTEQPEVETPVEESTQKPPIVEKPQTLDPNEIWHVMYRADGGQATVFVYPRCLNNPYHNPPRPPCADDYGITEETFLEVSRAFSIELQGDRESVQYLLGLALAEDNASLVQVGGVQGVVN